MKENKDISIKLPDEQRLPVDSDSFIKWLFFFFKPYLKVFILFFGVRALRYTILLLLPLVVGLSINAFENGWAFDDPKKLILLIGAYMVVYGAALFSMLFMFYESSAQDQMIRGMTLFSIKHMNQLPLSWHENQGSGGKLQRVMTARNAVKQLFNMYKWFLVPFLGSIFAITLSVFVMKAPPWFLLLYLGFMVSYCFVGWLVAKPLPELHNKHNILLEKLTSGVYEFISSVRTVKSFHMEKHIEGLASEREHDGHTAMRNVFRAIFKKWTTLNMVAFLWMCIFLTVCLSGVYQQWLTIGAFATVFYLAYDLWKTLESMVYIQDEFIEHRNGFLRLTETLKQPWQSLDHHPTKPLNKDWEQINFKQVSYSYTDEKHPALENISLSIHKGEKVALVGPSGAGKSTFIKLFMKQTEPSFGSITVDNIPLKNIRSSEWIGSMGFVPQDVELFNMSIKENILLDRIDTVPEDEYQNAINQAVLGEFINNLPEKDSTIVGERGIKLSGGQKQRLGIARALVRKAEIIVFDEATSSLDSLSEKAIQDAIDLAFSGKTLLVIAHRLSTVQHVDKIIVFDKGKIVETGSFRDLIKKQNIFAKMWALQSDNYLKEAS